MKLLVFILLLIAVGLGSCSFEKLYSMKQRSKVYGYEQVDFHDVVMRYMNKQQSSVGEIEGIYSVSMIVYKKGKGVLSSTEKEKISERKENYMQVAIIRDEGGANREFIEVPLEKKYLPSYSVRGEFSRMADANILVYKRLESRGKSSSYTFTFDRTKDILEGIRKENNGQFEYTHQLTYMKLHPKKSESSRK